MITGIESIEIVPKNPGYRYQLLINGVDNTPYLVTSRFTKPVTIGIGYFTMSIYNPGGLKSGSYSQGQAAKFYADHASGTTLQFWGIIDNIKERKDDKGQFLDFEGRHRSYMATERMVCYTADNRECSLILTDLVSTYLPGFTTVGVLPTGTYMTVTWNYKKVWECIEEICRFAGFDCYVDDNLDVHFFPENSIYNKNDAVVESQTYTNFLKIVDWGQDEYMHKTRATAVGEDDAGMIIVYTAIAADDDPTNPKEVHVKDTSARTFAAVKAMAESELAKYNTIVPRGTVLSFGLEAVNPGDNIVYLLQRQKIVGPFKLLTITQIAGTKEAWKTETGIEKEIVGSSQIIKDRAQTENAISYADNTNKLDFSYNLTFDDETNILSKTNTVVDGGCLKISSGTTGTMTTATKAAEITISKVELRAYGTDLGESSYLVSCDGTNYIAVVPNVLTDIPPAIQGSSLSVIATLTANVVTNPYPSLDSLATLYA